MLLATADSTDWSTSTVSTCQAPSKTHWEPWRTWWGEGCLLQAPHGAPVRNSLVRVGGFAGIHCRSFVGR